MDGWMDGWMDIVTAFNAKDKNHHGKHGMCVMGFQVYSQN